MAKGKKAETFKVSINIRTNGMSAEESRTNYSKGASNKANDSSSIPSKYPSPAISQTLLDQWDSIQNELRKQIIKTDTENWQVLEDLSGITRVAGIDISTRSKDHDAQECEAFAAVVVCKFPTMEILHTEIKQVHLSVPYAAGYLAFRESGPVVELLEKIRNDHPDKVPDVLLVDGNGMLHPHRCGLACHIGIKSSIPSIGVAKNLHLIEGTGVTKQMLQGMASVGDNILINDDSNETLGMALKTAKDTKNPMYVSIGHKISLDTAKRVVLKCCKYRVPEPIRFADNISREFIRKLEEESQSENT